MIALIPVLFFVIQMIFNQFIYGLNSSSGPNNASLILTSILIAILNKNYQKDKFELIFTQIKYNFQILLPSMLILLFVGAINSYLLISGVIPTIIYYGLNIIHPKIFLFTASIISATVSILVGSSWTTVATVGVSLQAIGNVLKFPPAMTAGCIISGAYFGDKLSPLSDTTNLAAGSTGVDIFTHISYMTYTTIPTYIISLSIYLYISIQSENTIDKKYIYEIQNQLQQHFFISIILLFPLVFGGIMIYKKYNNLLILMLICAVSYIQAMIFQQGLIQNLSDQDNILLSNYDMMIKSCANGFQVQTDNQMLNELLKTGGMEQMLITIWLIMCMVVFGSFMEGAGFLEQISSKIIPQNQKPFKTVLAVILTCISFNLIISDQYFAIILTAKIYKRKFEEFNFESKLLSRTLEDSGTLTSVLIP